MSESLEQIMESALAEQSATPAPAPAPSSGGQSSLEDLMREGLELQAKKQTETTTTKPDARPTLAKNTYNEAKANLDFADGEMPDAPYAKDGVPNTPRAAKFQATYRAAIKAGLGERVAYDRALAEWNAGQESIDSRTRRNEDQTEPGTRRSIDFARMSMNQLEEMAGVRMPPTPAQIGVAEDHYGNFLQWSFTNGIQPALAQDMIAFAADAAAFNVGQNIDADAMEQEFRERFGHHLSETQMALLSRWWRQEVLGDDVREGYIRLGMEKGLSRAEAEKQFDKEVAEARAQQAGDIFLSDATEEEIEALTDDEFARALLYELDLSPEQEAIRRSGRYEELRRTWTPRQARTVQKLGLDRDDE